MAKDKGVVEEIKALMPKAVGWRAWHERVAPEQQEMLDAILEAWRAGEFGRYRKTAATVISAYLARHGIEIGWTGVDAWLKQSGK